MEKSLSSSTPAFIKKLFLGYLPFSCTGVLLIFAAVAASTSWGALLAGGVFIKIWGGAFLILQLGVFCFRIDPLGRYLTATACTSLLNLLIGVPVLAFVMQTAYRWSQEQVENEPIVTCKKFNFRVRDDSETTQARLVMHQFAIDTQGDFDDPRSRGGIRATVGFGGSKFVLTSNDALDKYKFTVLHLAGGIPVRKGVRTDWCNSEPEITTFSELRERFTSKWKK